MQVEKLQQLQFHPPWLQAPTREKQKGQTFQGDLKDTEHFEQGPVSSAWSKTKAKVVSTASTASTEWEMPLLVGGCAWQMHCA